MTSSTNAVAVKNLIPIFLQVFGRHFDKIFPKITYCRQIYAAKLHFPATKTQTHMPILPFRNPIGAAVRWRGMCVADGETAETAAG